MRGRWQGGVTGTWTQHDTALWHTLDILAMRLTGTLDRRPTVLTSFAHAWGPDETILAQGPYELMQFTAADGGSFLIGGTGGLGLALLAGTAIYSANRRTEKWRRVDQGQLSVSTHGFYLASAAGLRPWSWDGIDAVTVAGPGAVYLQGRSDQGAAVCWGVGSDWSELLFVLWALARHRQHPQLLDGAWLPPGWTARAAHHGYATHRQSTDITRALRSPKP